MKSCLRTSFGVSGFLCLAFVLLLEVFVVMGEKIYHPGPHHQRGFNNTFEPGRHSTSFLMAFDRGLPCEMICTNLATGVSCTNRPPYYMNRVNGSSFHRNIISHKRNHSYALGFQQFAPGSFFLSIYTFSPNSKIAGSSIWTAKGPGHFAHGVVVDELATLGFLRKGVIELRNSRGTLVWTSGTGKSGAKTLEFNMDEGNLILYDRNNLIIWQSFDS